MRNLREKGIRQTSGLLAAGLATLALGNSTMHSLNMEKIEYAKLTEDQKAEVVDPGTAEDNKAVAIEATIERCLGLLLIISTGANLGRLGKLDFEEWLDAELEETSAISRS